MWHFKPVVTKSTGGEIGNFRNGNTMLLSLAPFRFCNKTQEFLNSLKLYCTCVHRVPLKADTLEQWSPDPSPQSSSGLWPVRNWAAEQEVSGGRVSEASSMFMATLCRWPYCPSSAFCHISNGIINIIT